MSATLKDVAKEAGVSIATVSYVLNNGPRPVSQETRDTVLKAIEAVGYQPRNKRKNKSTTNSSTIGVIVPLANSTFFGDAIEGIEDFLYDRNYNCIICSSHSNLAIEKALIRKLTKLVDGLIITPTAELYPEIEQLPEMGIPTVIMDRQIPSTVLSGVAIDNYNITVQAVNLLFDSGFEEIALITGPKNIDTMRARLDGFKDTLHRLGLPFNTEWVREVAFSAAAGRSAVLDLMSLHTPPQAIVCTTTDLTAGVLQGLKDLSLTMPDDVALVCYGDTIWAPLVSPKLTIIDAPARLMGETTARLLMNSISSPAVMDTKHIFLETKVILRESHRRQRSQIANR